MSMQPLPIFPVAAESEHASIYLKSAEVCLCETPTLVRTVLGSCVAVTMHSPKRKIGMICHALLPHRRDGETGYARDSEEPFKYVDVVLPYMTEQLKKLGIKRREINVKLFGGAEINWRIKGDVQIRSAAWWNVETAKRIIKEEKLRLKSVDVGGKQGRRILFYSDTGDVFLKRLQSKHRLPGQMRESDGPAPGLRA